MHKVGFHYRDDLISNGMILFGVVGTYNTYVAYNLKPKVARIEKHDLVGLGRLEVNRGMDKVVHFLPAFSI